MTLLAALCLISFSFVSCSGDDDDEDDDDITLIEDTSSDDASDDEETTSSDTTYVNGYAAVDLGLSVKWAAYNIGADSPEDYGNYYAWGETETKMEDSYALSNSVTYGVEMGDIAGRAKYDAATANWGDSWRMPTQDECQEIVENCAWELTMLNDVSGYLVTGSTGYSIFLPATGYRYGSTRYDAGYVGYYWSSTPYSSEDDYAYCLYFDLYTDYSSFYVVDDLCRYFGVTVRPVTD